MLDLTSKLPAWFLAVLVLASAALVAYGLSLGYTIVFSPEFKIVPPAASTTAQQPQQAERIQGPEPAQQPEQATPTRKAQYELRINSVDDAITCELNGKPIANAELDRPIDPLDVSQHVQPGKNRLRCVVADYENGECYAYDYELIRDKAEIVIHNKLSCCDPSCAKKTDTFALEDVFDAS